MKALPRFAGVGAGIYNLAMNRNLPALQEALEDWRDLAFDRDAADALLHFDEVYQRYITLHQHLDKLRTDPPQFDTIDLAAVLERLWSAQRVRNQIVEGNDLDVLVPTLRAFLFDNEESLEEKFAKYPARIRYAGHTILGELWGWTHIERWPIYNQRALAGLRLLGWDVPKQDYPAFARAFNDLRVFYEKEARVASQLPLNLEIDQLLDWVNDALANKGGARRAPAPLDEPIAYASSLPQRRSYAIREFGAPYDAAPAPIHTWPDQPLEIPTPGRTQEAETRIQELLALPSGVIRRAAAHLLAGRHLILSGAPGTGKSHLAMLLASEFFGHYPMLVTATAEWSTFDVVGGLVPVAGADGALRYDVRPGAVYESLRRNWLLAEDGSVRYSPEGLPLRVGATHDNQQWPGVWLVIDELNRADVDKAFGELFTALESGTLRVPRAGTDASLLIPLPKDFRIIATLNTRDRHFLFTLSDALKRRFALVEVGLPEDSEAEQATLLRRTSTALAERNLLANAAPLRDALATLYPVARLFRAFHTLGTAPLLAALQYVGAAQQLGPRGLNEILQEAVNAEIVPQLEGLHELPLRLLALLLRGERAAAFALLGDALSHAYGDVHPFRAVRALASLVSPKLEEQARQLQRGSLTDPAAISEALVLLDALRALADAIPAPQWPHVAAHLEAWVDERT